MADYKFDTFYYIEDQSDEHYLSEIEEISDDEYNTKYKGKMYCPFCKGPQLLLVKNAGISYLRTYPKQLHILVEGEMCPYECKTASKKMVEDYIKELRNKKKIQSLLEAIMRRLLKQETAHTKVTDIKLDTLNNPLIINSHSKDGQSKKSIIPHYSFKNWGKNVLQGQLLIVYGKVYVDLIEKEYTDDSEKVRKQIYIHFKDINSRKLITSCRKPEELKISKGNYYVVILGSCHPREVNKQIYYNLSINSPIEESILFKPFAQ